MNFKHLARLAVAAAIAASAILLAPMGAAGATGAQATGLARAASGGLLGTVFGLVDQVTGGGSHSGSGSTGSGSNSGSNSGSGSGDDTSSPDDEDGPEDGNKGKAKHEVPVVVHGAPPSIAKSFNAAPVAGKVLVRLPGKKAATALPAAASLPVGSEVDARAGVAKVTSARNASGEVQTARFTQGVFTVTQANSANPVTEIVLRGGHLGQCKRAAEAGTAVASRKRRGRRLWAEGKGHFRTRGRDGAATVRGTGWITTDTCSGTRVKVRHGLVAVRDFGLHKTVLVPGGKSYFAKHRGRATR